MKRIRTPQIAFLVVLALAGAPEASDGQSVIVIVGASGTKEYGAGFERWAQKWEEAARTGGAKLTRLGPVEGQKSDRDLLKEAIEREARASAESLWLVLIGHGTFDGREAKFNLCGPDFTAAELAEWLKGCDRPLAIINCASASGPFVNRLSGPGRAIVTATKSGYEHNYARFGGYLADGLAEEKIDIDKDGQVSLLEAFLAASARTAEFYEEEARLATEYALIDDNGDGLGTPAEWFRGIRATRRAKDGADLDGLKANQFFLVRSAFDQTLSADLRLRRDGLELAIAKLREEKESLDADAYYARLEPLILKLARLYENVENLENVENVEQKEEAGASPAKPRAR